MTTSKTAPQAKGKMANNKADNRPAFYDEIVTHAASQAGLILDACETITTHCGLTDKKMENIAGQLCGASDFLMKYPLNDWKQAEQRRIDAEENCKVDPDNAEFADILDQTMQSEEDNFMIYKALEMFKVAAYKNYETVTGTRYIPLDQRPSKNKRPSFRKAG